MLYLIGLGLNEKGISVEALEALKKCEKIYLENYTVNFPYSREQLERVIGKKIYPADRNFVESLEILDEAEDKNIALLVYGSPLFATTHISILEECKKNKIKSKIFHNASIFEATAETGLQPYKFGKVASIPEFKAESFIEIIKKNQKINAHSLILVDIGLGFKEAIEKLEKISKKKKINLGKLIVCSALGTEKSKIFYDKIKDLKNKKINEPYCFIIPKKTHFVEKEILENYEKLK